MSGSTASEVLIQLDQYLQRKSLPLSHSLELTRFSLLVLRYTVQLVMMS